VEICLIFVIRIQYMLFHIPTMIYIIIGGLHSYYVAKKNDQSITLKAVSFHVAWTALIESVSSMGYINLGWIVFITPFIGLGFFIAYIMRLINPMLKESLDDEVNAVQDDAPDDAAAVAPAAAVAHAPAAAADP
jgi:D-alanyl-lipoteichoic acid acyltransferase DltB (MBOAT superfamily)